MGRIDAGPLGLSEDKRKGLDETRRLLYMANRYRDVDETIPADLHGTITNALTHHHRELGFADWYWQVDEAIAAITAALGD